MGPHSGSSARVSNVQVLERTVDPRMEPTPCCLQAVIRLERSTLSRLRLREARMTRGRIFLNPEKLLETPGKFPVHNRAQ